MADLILGYVVDAIVSKVVAAASEQVNMAVGWKQDLEWFCLKMKMLGGLLRDADEKRETGNHRFKDWLLELKAVAEDAEDIFEDVAYENLRQQVTVQNSKSKKVSSYFTLSKYNPLAFRLRMANRVKSLNARLKDILTFAADLGLQNSFASSSITAPVESYLETHSFLPSKVVGREEDVYEVVSLLMDSTSHHGEQDLQLPVVTIVGLPGLGKTTLAKAVLETKDIRVCFDKNIIWLCVSENFEVKRILVEILESITGSSCEDIRTKNVVLQKIQENLDGKKFLLVLDDVWNDNRAKWDDLRNCLMGISKTEGSRLLVTTRSQKVAELMSLTRDHICHPKKLGENECWAIIQQRAFGSSSVPEELEVIGREIAEKCNGLPLVANVIGGLLRNARDRKEWLSVKDMDSWHFLEEDEGISAILQLSFDRLPNLALKQCFAFCSIFPKDFVMKKEVLIQLWMAEGYLQPLEGSSMEMEEIGDKYFNDLLCYSLLEEEDIDSFGEIRSCKMHDLIHDLAQLVSKSETVILESSQFSKKPSPASVRYRRKVIFPYPISN